MIKMNWGLRIAFLYGGFVLLIAALVINSMRQNFDLVASDYYQQEIEYQKIIDAGKNQATLSSPVQIQTNEENIILNFPKEFSGKILAGEIQFYSTVNANWDKNIKLSTESNSVIIPRNELNPTEYKVKIKWQSERTEYYQESTVNLSK